MTHLLEQITHPDQLKGLTGDQLEQLAEEIRALIIGTVSTNGGHLASNLGMVELTIALLVTFTFPRDQIVFDVGHQTYTWKILTGRREQFCSLRRLGGLSGFPKISESDYDCFNTGHSSTSISAALGLSRAQRYLERAGRTIAVIGDGALTGGMAFEALNDAGQSGENLIVILNDNQMSIGRNVGGLARHLEKLRISTPYLRMRGSIENLVTRIPLVGRPSLRLLRRLKQLTRMVILRQGIFFEQLGFKYYGPIDGHDLPGLVHHLEGIAGLDGPVLLHVVTQKGKGYRYAEESPDVYHGVAPFVIENGVTNGTAANPVDAHSFSDAFGRTMVDLARHNSRICAISAAMTSGTGLAGFAKAFPARFYDVGIAEQHAMTLAAGLAAGGMQPVVALYSTFLQRAFDQLLHDVCLQCLPVVIAVDRAGIVGEDGETHQGIYDLSLLLPLPGLEIYCPATYEDLETVLRYAVQAGKPVAIRYPRGRPWPGRMPEPQEVRLAPGSAGETKTCLLDRYKLRCLRPGSQVTLAALGILAGPALDAADILAGEGIDTEVLSVLCVKPFDLDSLVQSAQRTGRVLLIEESLVKGGMGQTVLPDLLRLAPGTSCRLMGIEDSPLCQGKRDELLQAQKLDSEGIAAAVRSLLNGCSRSGSAL
ncbi:MAG: 1-deoxy-D-xylulose-5-phosphate synthase [Clostridiaceae bacterium]|nr:1-deoxy-D-xylulose-5-phosphate synthase [Clostridiaceae bacterium]